MTEQNEQADQPNQKYKSGDALIDVAGLIGAGSVTYGVWLVYHPAAFIIGGVMILIAAWLAAPKSDA
jgi:hypothetical protein